MKINKELFPHLELKKKLCDFLAENFLHSSDPSCKPDKGLDHCSSLKLLYLVVIFSFV